MRSSRKIIIGLLLTFIASGSLDAFFPKDSAELGLLHGFIILGLIFWWLDLHAMENGVAIPKGSKILTLFFPPLGLPYYFYKGYGFKRGAYLILIALLLSVVAVCMYVLGFGATNQFHT